MNDDGEIFCQHKKHEVYPKESVEKRYQLQLFCQPSNLNRRCEVVISDVFSLGNVGCKENFESGEETKWHFDDGTAQYTITLSSNQLSVEGAELLNEFYPEFDIDSMKNHSTEDQQKPQQDILNTTVETKLDVAPNNYKRKVMLDIINELEAEVESDYFKRNFKFDDLEHDLMKSNKENVNEGLNQKMNFVEEELNKIEVEDVTDLEQKSEKQLKPLAVNRNNYRSSKNLSCRKCKKKFARKYGLRRHMENRTCEEGKRAQKKYLRMKQKGQETESMEKDSFKLNSKNFPKQQLPPQLPGNVRHTCLKCRKTFLLKNALIRHSRLCGVKYKPKINLGFFCSACKAGFSCKFSLDRHVRKHCKAV
ncbi:hypothetical protein LSTR_LSTR000943 [Laodelphax striatellus]|uniref:C2H2-type domain-containing protein n=1 Tax=Laodelphax striatellus TaxID=195883 RepID=A0A482X1A0_LAOST|nr:hypothetical protein LSTR_LSTR000943 [Laodelphax striatellus]